jgi:hypothetical protein
VSVSRQEKRNWANKFERVNLAREKAQEDWLILIHQARQAGLSQSDVAYMADGVSPSGVPAKEALGKAVLEKRKGGSGQP